MKGRTRVNHPPEAPLPADNRPLVAPIHQPVKFAFDTLEETLRFNRGEREGYFYTRRSNATTRQLELLLAELQQRDDCVATGSGAAAVATALISQLRAGDLTRDADLLERAFTEARNRIDAGTLSSAQEQYVRAVWERQFGLITVG